jgi:hypothetical protein
MRNVTSTGGKELGQRFSNCGICTHRCTKPVPVARDNIKSAFSLRTVVCVCYFYSKSTHNKLERMTDIGMKEITVHLCCKSVT